MKIKVVNLDDAFNAKKKLSLNVTAFFFCLFTRNVLRNLCTDLKIKKALAVISIMTDSQPNAPGNSIAATSETIKKIAWSVCPG